MNPQEPESELKFFRHASRGS